VLTVDLAFLAFRERILTANCKFNNKVKVVGSRPTAANGGVAPAPIGCPGFLTARYRRWAYSSHFCAYRKIALLRQSPRFGLRAIGLEPLPQRYF